jgi:hypothetical protein
MVAKERIDSFRPIVTGPDIQLIVDLTLRDYLVNL